MKTRAEYYCELLNKLVWKTDCTIRGTKVTPQVHADNMAGEANDLLGFHDEIDTIIFDPKTEKFKIRQ